MRSCTTRALPLHVWKMVLTLRLIRRYFGLGAPDNRVAGSQNAAI